MADAGFKFIVIHDVVVRVGDLETTVKIMIRLYVGKGSEFEVMGGNEPGDGKREQFLKEAAGTVELVAGVCSFQYLVEDDKCLFFPFSHRDKLLQAEQFGVEIGRPLGEVIHRPHTREYAHGLELERGGTHHCTATGENEVYPDGTQEGTLARHIRSRDDVKFVKVIDAKVVCHAAVGGE